MDHYTQSNTILFWMNCSCSCQWTPLHPDYLFICIFNFSSDLWIGVDSGTSCTVLCIVIVCDWRRMFWNWNICSRIALEPIPTYHYPHLSSPSSLLSHLCSLFLKGQSSACSAHYYSPAGLMRLKVSPALVSVSWDGSRFGYVSSTAWLHCWFCYEI